MEFRKKKTFKGGLHCFTSVTYVERYIRPKSRAVLHRISSKDTGNSREVSLLYRFLNRFSLCLSYGVPGGEPDGSVRVPADPGPDLAAPDLRLGSQLLLHTGTT